MKVLHLIDSGGLYGAEKMLLALVAEQNAMGVEATICSVGLPRENEKPIESEANELGLPVISWRMKAGINILGALKILTWAREHGYLVLHSHGYKFNILMALIPRFIRKLPIVATVHGYVNASRYSKMWIYEMLDQWALKHLDQVCVVSTPMLSMKFAIPIPNSKLNCITNGISVSLDVQQMNDDIIEFRNKVSFCFCAIGRLSPEKGFDDLILAFSNLMKINNSLKSKLGLVILGEGYMEQKLLDLIQNEELSEQVLLAGYQKNAGATLKNFDALVMPSRTEGLPITLLEAMRAKCPIIANKVGGISSVVNEDSAYLLQDGDIEQLSLAMENIAKSDLEAIQKSEQAFLDFKNSFSAGPMAVKYLDVYYKLNVE